MAVSLSAVAPEIRAANHVIVDLLGIGASKASQALAALHDDTALRSRDLARLITHATEGADELGQAVSRAHALGDNLFVSHSSVRNASWAERALREALESAAQYATSDDKAYARTALRKALEKARDSAEVAHEVGTGSLGQAARKSGAIASSYTDDAESVVSDARSLAFMESGTEAIDPTLGGTASRRSAHMSFDAHDPLYDSRSGAANIVDGYEYGFLG